MGYIFDTHNEFNSKFDILQTVSSIAVGILDITDLILLLSSLKSLMGIVYISYPLYITLEKVVRS